MNLLQIRIIEQFLELTRLPAEKNRGARMAAQQPIQRKRCEAGFCADGKNR